MVVERRSIRRAWYDPKGNNLSRVRLSERLSKQNCVESHLGVPIAKRPLGRCQGHLKTVHGYGLNLPRLSFYNLQDILRRHFYTIRLLRLHTRSSN